MQRFRRATILIAVLTCLSALATTRAIARDQSYKVGDGMCEYSITFDDAKVDRKTFQNTVAMIYGGEGSAQFAVSQSPNPSKDVTAADVDTFSGLCRSKLEELDQLQVLPMPLAQAQKRLLRDQLAEMCTYEVTLSRALVRGTDPTILNDFAPAKQQCGNFVRELQSRATLRTFWQNLVAVNCKKNANPAQCVSRGLADGNRPDADEAIRKYVLIFGWNNCSTKFLSINQVQPWMESRTAALRKEFEAHFKVSEKCDSD